MAPLREADIELPAELAEVLAADPEYAEAFAALTPGRRRAYGLHVGQAARAGTRVARAWGHRERVLAGYGLQDCTCGLSRRMPGCDGSHRALGDGRGNVLR